MKWIHEFYVGIRSVITPEEPKQTFWVVRKILRALSWFKQGD